MPKTLNRLNRSKNDKQIVLYMEGVSTELALALSLNVRPFGPLLAAALTAQTSQYGGCREKPCLSVEPGA